MKRSVEVTVEKVVFGGDGLARLQESSTPSSGSKGGKVIFIPFTAPGEKVEVLLEQDKSGYARGQLQKIKEPSPHRETPLCPYFQKCGGCQYQHLAYEEELRLKTLQVRETWMRIAKQPSDAIREIIASPQAYAYRNRITIHQEQGIVGFHRHDGKGLLDVRECALAMPEVNEALRIWRSRRGRRALGHHSLRLESIPPSGFYQSNHFLLSELQKQVQESFSSESSQLLEGYAGGGFFTKILREDFEKLWAIERDPRVLKDVEEWQSKLPLSCQKKITWIEGDAASSVIELLQKEPRDSLAVLLDPPRGGLPSTLVQALCQFPPREFTYVSCDPPALAREAAFFQEKFDLKYVQPLDLFPRTAQIECVAVWRRR